MPSLLSDSFLLFSLFFEGKTSTFVPHSSRTFLNLILKLLFSSFFLQEWSNRMSPSLRLWQGNWLLGRFPDASRTDRKLVIWGFSDVSDALPYFILYARHARTRANYPPCCTVKLTCGYQPCLRLFYPWLLGTVIGTDSEQANSREMSVRYGCTDIFDLYTRV